MEGPFVRHAAPPPLPPRAQSLVMDEISDSEDVGKFVGQVKWWNDQLGFGFATVMSGDDKGRDVFVHHTGIRAKNTNYRTLLQGEYLNFDITNSQSGVQAVNVTGVCGGLLMCEQKSWKRSMSLSSSGHAFPSLAGQRAASGGSLASLGVVAAPPSRSLSSHAHHPPYAAGAAAGAGGPTTQTWRSTLRSASTTPPCVSSQHRRAAASYACHHAGARANSMDASTRSSIMDACCVPPSMTSSMVSSTDSLESPPVMRADSPSSLL